MLLPQRDCTVNSCRKGNRIVVCGANHNHEMVGAAVVKPNKMLPIHGENRPVLRYRNLKSLRIGRTPIRQTAFLNRQ